MKIIKNFLLILVSTAFSLILVEIALRIFTKYPIFPNSSNMLQDSNFGFKMNNDLEEIDKLGFRNVDGKYNKYQLAAIGDSHTYGNGVINKDAWPYQLEEIIGLPIYNYGNSGNGIYSYHYLAKDALSKNKKIIIGLYLPNDFAYKDYACLIDFNNSFWKKEVNKLNLNNPLECDSLKHVKTKMDFVRLAIIKSAVISITYDLVWKTFKTNKNRIYIEINKHFPPIETEILEGFMKLTDLKNPKISLVFSDFKKIVNDWKKSSDEGSIGIILIPSAQAVYLNALEKLDMKANSESKIEFYTQNELLLEKLVLNFLQELNIPTLSVKKNLVENFIKDHLSDNTLIFYPDNSHPIRAGHQAYAKTAKEIYLKMKEISK